MKKLIILIILILCATSVTALQLDYTDQKIVRKGDHAIVSFGAGEINFPDYVPYIELAREEVTLPGTRKIIDTKVNLSTPVSFDLNLPIVKGYDKNDFQVMGDFECDLEITAGVASFLALYENGVTQISLDVNPLQMNSCGKFTFTESGKKSKLSISFLVRVTSNSSSSFRQSRNLFISFISQ